MLYVLYVLYSCITKQMQGVGSVDMLARVIILHRVVFARRAYAVTRVVSTCIVVIRMYRR